MRTITRPVKVGDIFVASWGYDQTNIDFWQVTKTTAKSVWVQQVESHTVGETRTSNVVMPMKDAFKTEWVHPTDEDGHYLLDEHGGFVTEHQVRPPVLKRLDLSGSVPSIKVFDWANAYLWDGKGRNETKPEYGH